jgi:hypothetical protein
VVDLDAGERAVSDGPLDAENALEQLPPKEEGEEGNEANEGADDEMQWRELCTSIARAADEEKATLLEELNIAFRRLRLVKSHRAPRHLRALQREYYYSARILL